MHYHMHFASLKREPMPDVQARRITELLSAVERATSSINVDVERAAYAYVARPDAFIRYVSAGIADKRMPETETL